MKHICDIYIQYMSLLYVYRLDSPHLVGKPC